ncbi:hypothetical protein IAQ61_011854 [Plenodomus lingam]|uniref:uncharacterized protein n=1 Tax=Leptosphaeria maculans TaxID=5022 RepID=UPI00331F38A4|nr:hypothetical protein IAQ61_011854 [Plenodomus lingam]
MKKSLKNKASRFFRDGPSQDEKAAIASAADDNGGFDFDFGFDAGIQDQNAKSKDNTVGAFALPTAPLDPVRSSKPALNLPEVEPEKSKSRSSLTALKLKSSRFFRNTNYGSQSPPRPLSPQISVSPTPTEPELPRPIPAPVPTPRGSRSSFITTSKGRTISISRPMALQQPPHSPLPKHPATVPFTKPKGPPPPRPPRPTSIDQETLAFMRDATTRMALPFSPRASTSTASSTSPRTSTISCINSRLGLPDGYGTPRKNTLESPLAAQVPADPLKPLPVRDSDGSVKFSRFSEFIKAEREGYADAGAGDGGPIEQYDEGREGDWTLVKRTVQGPGDQPGMLFRDRAGGLHFVADV